MKKLIISTSLVALSSSYLYGASNDSWEQILSQVKDDTTGKVGVLYDTNSQRTGTIYNSRVVYQFSGGNSDGDWNYNLTNKTGETVQVTVTKPNGQVISTSGYLGPVELSAWADAHKTELLSAVFDGDPSSTVGGTTASTSEISQGVIEQITNSALSGKSTVKNAVRDKGYTAFNSVIIMDSEKATPTDRGIKAKTTAYRFSYDFEIENGDEVGGMFQYRNTKSTDVYGSKAKSYSIAPFYKHYNDLTDKIELATVGNLFLGYKDMDSSLFPDGMQYMEYGFGASAIPSYHVSDKTLVYAPIGFQSTKKNMKNKVPEELSFLVDAINNVGFQNSINYGVGSEYMIKDNWSLRGDIFNTKQVGSNTSYNKDQATYYSIKTNYFTDSWSYVFGFKTVKGIADYSENAYMLSINYNL